MMTEPLTTEPLLLEPRVHDLVAAQPADRVALVHRDQRLTYGELNARADHLADRLAHEGVTLETPVGVFLERSPEFVVTILAVLRAGGHYVPLDPAYPAHRLDLMVDATGTTVIVTDPDLAGRLPATGATVLTPGTDPTPASSPSPSHRPRVGPDNLAYVMFTSGSTGRPKGVAVRHSGVTRLVHRPGYADLDGEVVLHMSSPSFDAATFEIWGALANGARLVISPSGQASVRELGALIREHRVTTAFLTTGLFHLMADECPEALAGMRQLLTGGDVLSPTHARRFVEAAPGCRLINAYGPTEATTFTTTHPVTGGNDTAIGHPIRATSVHVLDEDLAPAAEGRLYVGGAGLARGYLGDPALTAERFVPDPWTPGGRLYDTGDLVRLRPDGALEFLGRADDQVKRRGFRVEPAEIEEALRADPDVRDAAVVVRGEAAEDKILVAHVVTGRLAQVRSRLTGTLPAYLLPDRWLVAPGLPLNPNGKVDRRALRDLPDASPPPASPPVGEQPVGEQPVSEVEASIAAIWRELFALGDIGRHDDFFELGGHSLLANRMVSRLRVALGVEISLSLVFDHPTIAEMAELVEAA
ncbi:hypothetical protein GCM10009678_00660 [Actinomadura kijaniata]|uniref:Amino acid adenylation domain-containing protein n=1 Tax=Actinomadura namibiensis TaxID=182080 RepID=A0A7W3LSC5_ACTNM|nr:non-ribosomal peptide synthetase [Actinomadura namibiensis]MBA8953408.1 amino acid adenylation domain-containing protein [Actinomadura namibiensis]